MFVTCSPSDNFISLLEPFQCYLGQLHSPGVIEAWVSWSVAPGLLLPSAVRLRKHGTWVPFSPWMEGQILGRLVQQVPAMRLLLPCVWGMVSTCALLTLTRGRPGCYCLGFGAVYGFCEHGVQPCMGGTGKPCRCSSEGGCRCQAGIWQRISPLDFCWNHWLETVFLRLIACPYPLVLLSDGALQCPHNSETDIQQTHCSVVARDQRPLAVCFSPTFQSPFMMFWWLLCPRYLGIFRGEGQGKVSLCYLVSKLRLFSFKFRILFLHPEDFLFLHEKSASL